MMFHFSCVYRILANPGETIRLEFETIETEFRRDFIEVYRSGFHPSNFIGNYSGSHRSS